MSRLSTSLAIWISITSIGIYYFLYYSTNYMTSRFIADFLAVIGLSFMSASMLPVAYRAFANGLTTNVDRWVFSFWFLWTLALLVRCWGVFLALLKNSDIEAYNWWYYSPISGLIGLSFALAAGFGASAPFTGDLPIPRRELIIFTIAAGFSGIIAGIAIGVFIVVGWTN